VQQATPAALPDDIRLRIPLLPLLIVLAAATAFLWYRDRPMPPGHCTRCGYDLTGNVSGICPECGVPIPEATKEALTQQTDDDKTQRAHSSMTATGGCDHRNTSSDL
jgi:hypothetical protein